MHILEMVTRALGNCRSVQLSYGAFTSSQRKPAILTGLPHTSPTPDSPDFTQTNSAFRPSRPLVGCSVASTTFRGRFPLSQAAACLGLGGCLTGGEECDLIACEEAVAIPSCSLAATIGKDNATVADVGALRESATDRPVTYGTRDIEAAVGECSRRRNRASTQPHNQSDPEIAHRRILLRLPFAPQRNARASEWVSA